MEANKCIPLTLDDEIKMVQHLLRYISEDDLISMYYSKDVSVACGAWEEISEHSCLEIAQLGEKVHLNMTPLSSYMGLFNRSD